MKATLNVIFNPYNKQDVVYKADGLSEYIENELGTIWLGSLDSNAPLRWQ